MRLLAPLLLAMFQGACGPADADIPVRVWRQITLGSPDHLHVSVGNDEDCVSLPGDARMLLGGTPLPNVYLGGSGFDWRNLEPRCELAGFSGEVQGRAEEMTTLQLLSGTERLFDIEAALFAERRLVLVSPPDGVLRPGVEVVLQWLPETDTLPPYRTVEGAPQIFISHRSTSSWGSQVWISFDQQRYIQPGSIAQEGSILRFTVASVPDNVTESALRLNSLYVSMTPARCEGRYHNCDISLSSVTALEVPVTFQRP